MDNKIIGVAGTVLLGLASWIATTVYQLSVSTEIIKDKMERVYQDDCPYCIHAAHRSIKEHPLLSPTIKHAHQHVGKNTISIN